MNVVGARPDKWWNDPDRAVRAMVSSLNEFAHQTGDELTAVLDADPGGLPEARHLRVVVASRKGRNAADDEIVKMLESMDDRTDIRVVTSDKRLGGRVGQFGVSTFPAGVFRGRLDSIVPSS